MIKAQIELPSDPPKDPTIYVAQQLYGLLTRDAVFRIDSISGNLVNIEIRHRSEI